MEEEWSTSGRKEKTSADDPKRYLPSWLTGLFDKYIRDCDERKPGSNLSFLEDVRKLFPRGEDGTLEPNKVLDELSSESGDAEETIIDDECRNMSEFVDRVRDFLKTRTSTLTGPLQRTLPTKFENEYYNEFKRYLNEHGFMEKMVDVIYKMFLLHPSIPKDPIAYIRDNYGVTKEGELALVKKWLKLKCQIDSLKKENLELKSRVSAVLSKKTPIGNQRQSMGSTVFIGDTLDEPLVNKSLISLQSGIRRSLRRKSMDSKKKKKQLRMSTVRYSYREDSLKSSRKMESWMNLHPVARPVIEWDFQHGEDFFGHDSKVPFDFHNYDLNVTWNKKKVPDELIINEEGVGERKGQTEELTSSSSDYSVVSLPSLGE